MGEWTPEAFASELDVALSKLDRQRATTLCEELAQQLGRTGHTYPEEWARKHLRALRNKRYFELVLLLADRMLRAQPEARWIERDQAQALLDLGQVVAAVAVLERLDHAKKKPLPEELQCEVHGLLGRAYKQMYVDAASDAAWAERALRTSISHYLGVYRRDSEQVWHGINAASLLFRATRERIKGLGKLPDPASLARKIMKTIERRALGPGLNAWDRATAAEALIGLGDYANAGRYLGEYVSDAACDAFELASTYRQLTEVVQLGERKGEERLLVDVVRAALLKRQNGAFVATAHEVGERATRGEQLERGLQKVFGADQFVDHGWLLKAFRRAMAVARIKARGRTFGTAFLVPGKLLHDKWKEHQVVLTNNHVVSQRPRLIGLRPDEIEIVFDAVPALAALRVETVLWESPMSELDVTVMKLQQPVAGVEDMCVASALPALDPPPPPRMYIIGHPKGSDLAYSLHDNHLLGVSERRIHYRSPTDEGSSGSPVFDEHWDLVAIHRRGDDAVNRLDDPNKTYEANEGVPIQTIMKAITAKPN